MVYRPPFRKQGDGSRCQWQNCGPASQAMASHRHRKGVDPRTSGPWPPMPQAIRNRISPSGCGGTNLNQNDSASISLYLSDMWVRYDLPWDTFRSLIISGRGAHVAIRYSMVPAKFDGSPGFNGGHSVYVNERRSSDGAFLVYDPLADGRRSGIPTAPDWWPASVLKAAAGSWTGTGKIDASFTRDTEA